MSDELKDILGNSNKDIDNQQLMDYLSRQLSKQDTHDLEKAMADDEFVNDAVEGLQQFENKKDLNAYVQQLNDDLKKQLEKKKARKDKRKLENYPWIHFAVVLLLLLCIIAFVVIKYNAGSKKLPKQPSVTATIYKDTRKN
jgi:type II secretory pathway component PulF